ncbi:hypothetical protein ACA910_003375 [Epithemia clementina (nom. ined.)]
MLNIGANSFGGQPLKGTPPVGHQRMEDQDEHGLLSSSARPQPGRPLRLAPPSAAERATSPLQEDEMDDLEEEDGNTAYERNDDLSQTELSSVGSVKVEAPPATSTLVWLGEDKCRVEMNCKPIGESNYVLAFCGNEARSCRHRGHTTKQEQPHARGTIAFYVGVMGRGQVLNGRKDKSSYSRLEYKDLHSAEVQDLETAGEGFAEATQEEAGEEASLTEFEREYDTGRQSPRRGVG